MWDWGRAVRWCRMFDHDGGFCKFCQAVNRAFFIYILRRNPTFSGWQPKDND